MCTLLVQHRPDAEHPLIIAANRDEQLQRPAEPPALRTEGPIPYVAPRDLQASGTWLGLNARGLFVAITNRHGAPPDPDRRSRGELVVQALAAPDAASARASMRSLPPRDYNGFHLLHADAHEASITWSDGETLHQQQLAPGVVHALTERSFTSDAAARAARGLAAWPSGTTAPTLESLQRLVGLHAEPGTQLPLFAPCVHLDTLNYGTRSSSVLRLSRRLRSSDWRWAEGPPCRTPFVDLAPLLDALGSADASLQR